MKIRKKREKIRDKRGKTKERTGGREEKREEKEKDADPIVFHPIRVSLPHFFFIWFDFKHSEGNKK